MRIVYKDICANLIRLIVLLCLFGHYSDNECPGFLTYSAYGSSSYDEGNSYLCLNQTMGSGTGNDFGGNSERTNLLALNLAAVMSIFVPGVEAQETVDFTYSKQGIRFSSIENTNGNGFANIKRHVENQEGDSFSHAEHGSGSYSSETTTEFVSINTSDELVEDDERIYEHAPFFDDYPYYDSISSKNDSLLASYSGTPFPLPHQRFINFASRWSDVTQAASKQEELSFVSAYRYATKLNKSINLILDEYDLGASFKSDFQGAADIQFKSQFSNYMERYVGTFKVDEDVTPETAAFSSSGNGYISIDKSIKKDGFARSYEQGSGDFNLEEQIEPEDHYLTKSLKLTYRPVEFDLGFGNSLNHSLKWNEGVSSEETDHGRISEKFTSLDEMEKDTIISDITQIKTEAKFTGKGEFSVETTNITDEQVYTGNYNIRRNVSIEQIPRYEKPHITAFEEVYFDPANCSIVNYEITLTNDGNTDLWPIYIKNTFPIGSTFLESSLDPIELTSRYANWSIQELYPGETVRIWLKLSLIKKVDKLTNRVRATAYALNTAGRLAKTYGDYNSTILLDPDRCAPQELLLSMSAAQDADNKHNVTYRMTLENQADYNMSVNLSADVINNATILTTSPKPNIVGEDSITWSFKLLAGKKKTLSYKLDVKSDGLVSSSATAYADSLDGQRHLTRSFRASVFIAKPSKLSVDRIVDDWLPEDLADPLSRANTYESVPCLCLSLPEDTIAPDRPEIKLVRDLQGYTAELPCC